MKRRLIILISWILLACLVLAGCRASETVQDPKSSESRRTSEERNSQSTIAPAARENRDGRGDGEITLAIPAPETLLPWEIKDEATADMLSLVFEPLWVFGEDGRIRPVLAESVTFADDASFIDVELKHDIYFHDGSMLDAGDVAFSVEQLRKQSNYYMDRLSRISRTTIVDFFTIRLYLRKDTLASIEDLVFPVFSENTTAKMDLIGTGPYCLESVKDRREMVLTAFEDYHGTEPQVSTIRCLFVENEKAVLQAFSSGRSDLFHEDPFTWSQYQFQEKYTVYSYPSLDALYLAFADNSFGSVLSNRQKIAFAISTEEVLKDAAWGHGKYTDVPFYPSHWYAPELEERYPKDSQKAEAIAISGVSIETIRLLYDPGDPVSERAAESVRRQLKEAGMDTTLVTDGVYDIQIVHEEVGLFRAFSLLDDPERLLEITEEEELTEEVMNMAVYAQVKVPFYFLCYLDGGVVTSSYLSGRLTPADGFAYLGAEYLK